MKITSRAVESYMYGLLPKRDEVLMEMEAVAAKQSIPIVGPAVGVLLYQLARSIRARRIFEMGSAIGYSTIWLARAVEAGGKVYYTDGSASNVRKAENYLTRAGVRERVEILVGDALDLIDEVSGDFDAIFNDIDKHGYPDAYRKTAGRIRVGGLLIADNVLWSGMVADPSVKDPDTRAIRAFNDMLYADSRYCTTIIPLRDGVAVGLRVA